MMNAEGKIHRSAFRIHHFSHKVFQLHKFMALAELGAYPSKVELVTRFDSVAFQTANL
jgi:hypothetical protein